MKAYGLKVTGIKNVQKMFKRYGEVGEQKFDDITAIRAEDIKYNAKGNAQMQGIWDTGKLVQHINSDKDSSMNYTIYAGMHYSAYMEFGTGRLVDVPKGMEAIAWDFKGSGVKEVNIPARPFLYPALKGALKPYIKDLNRGIQELNQKFNK